MSEDSVGFGRYTNFYGPQGRLVLVDSALEAVNRGSTTIGIKTHQTNAYIDRSF